MLNSDFKDILKFLNEENAEYLLVRASVENARKVYNALSRFGAPLHQIKQEEFSKDDVVYQIGVKPCRIDILTWIDGLSFDEAAQSHCIAELDGLSIPIPSKACIIQNKKSTGREKDLLDVKMLEESDSIQ